MIPNQWYAVLESNEVPANKVIGVTRMGEKLVFWRDAQGQVSCLRDFCPHRGVALCTGKVVEGSLQCPFHGFRFDTTGRCTLIPANGRNGPISREMKAFNYPTHEAHGLIFIWWGQPAGELQPPRWFDDLHDGQFSHATLRDPWHTHYSRVIENQLDVAHLPFIHRNSIGRSIGSLVDGPLLEWHGADEFWVHTFNRADDGAPPRRPSELSRPDRPFRLEFIFPNLWQNHISETVRITVAFAPVDDEHTILYLRFYQNFMRTPVLGALIARLAMPLNLKVAHEDRHVVETELPKRTALKIGEKLIQADHPIVAYRRRREELIAAGQQSG